MAWNTESVPISINAKRSAPDHVIDLYQPYKTQIKMHPNSFTIDSPLLCCSCTYCPFPDSQLACQSHCDVTN